MQRPTLPYLERLVMAFSIPVNAIVEFGLQSTVDGQRCLTLLHYRVTGAELPNGNDDLEQIVDSMGGTDQIVQLYVACMSDSATFDGVSYQQIWAPTPFVLRRPRGFNAFSAGEGGYEGVMLPVATSVAITKLTDVASRRGLGTVHMPAVPADFVAGSLVSGAGVARYDEFRNTIPSDIVYSTTTLVPLIWNRTDPANSLVIQDTALQTSVRTMRRRVVGRGV